MLSNRELFASMTLEAQTEKEKAAEEKKPTMADLRKQREEEEKQNANSRHVINCMKRALARSLSLQQMRESLRPLDPSTDFQMVTRVAFDGVRTRRDADTSGFNCCNALFTRKDKPDEDQRKEMIGEDTLRPTSMREPTSFSASSGSGTTLRAVSAASASAAAAGGGEGGGGDAASLKSRGKTPGGKGLIRPTSGIGEMDQSHQESKDNQGGGKKGRRSGAGAGRGRRGGGRGTGGRGGGEDEDDEDYQNDSDSDTTDTDESNDSDYERNQQQQQSEDEERRKSGGGGGSPSSFVPGVDPNSNIPFEFTDFAPMVYRHIRQFLGIDSDSFLKVLIESNWHKTGAGKSSAALYFCGQNWVIKTMVQHESDFLSRILHRYYYHVRDNQHTLLPHFVGHHQLKFKDAEGIDVEMKVIIMRNVFATPARIHWKFDLKGSTVGRFATKEEKKKLSCTRKDLDIDRPLRIAEPRRTVLIEQLRRDCDFLRRNAIMDYSFLVGIVELKDEDAAAAATSNMVSQIQSGGDDPTSVPRSRARNRGSSLAVGGGGGDTNNTLLAGSGTNNNTNASSSLDDSYQQPQQNQQNQQQQQIFNLAQHSLQHGLDQQDNNNLEQTAASSSSSSAAAASRRWIADERCFNADSGGMLSTRGDELYFIAVIDVLQEYNAWKTAETYIQGLWKEGTLRPQRISSLDPKNYASRFINFVDSLIL